MSETTSSSLPNWLALQRAKNASEGFDLDNLLTQGQPPAAINKPSWWDNPVGAERLNDTYASPASASFSPLVDRRYASHLITQAQADRIEKGAQDYSLNLFGDLSMAAGGEAARIPEGGAVKLPMKRAPGDRPPEPGLRAPRKARSASLDGHVPFPDAEEPPASTVAPAPSVEPPAAATGPVSHSLDGHVPFPDAVPLEPRSTISGLQVRPPTEDVGRAMDATFTYGKDLGPSEMPIGQLSGGTSNSKVEAARVNGLKARISGDGGYISRLIVDSDGNVIEGQHRLEALRQLGAQTVPVHVVHDLATGINTNGLGAVIRDVQGMHSDQRKQLIGHILDALHEEGGSVAGVRNNYEAPRGYEKAWNAALTFLGR